MPVKSLEPVLKLIESQKRLSFPLAPSKSGRACLPADRSGILTNETERFSPRRVAPAHRLVRRGKEDDRTSLNDRQTAKILTIRFSLLVLFVLLTFFPCPAAQSQEISDEPEPPVFSNKDLENYTLPTYDKIPGTGTNYGGPSDKEDIRRKAREIQKQDEQEYWCKKATSYAKKVGKAKNKIRDSENSLSELTDSCLAAGGSKRKTIEKKIRKTEQTLEVDKTRLKELEEDLSELEGEAHRKGVPPGWLRCQFE